MEITVSAWATQEEQSSGRDSWFEATYDEQDRDKIFNDFLNTLRMMIDIRNEGNMEMGIPLMPPLEQQIVVVKETEDSEVD